jgi:hypothetical protein
VSAALLLLWGPEIPIRRRRADAPVALVQDASASMAVADAGAAKKPRAAAAAAAVEDLRSLFSRRSAPVYFRLGARLEKTADWRPPAAAPLSDFSLLGDVPRAAPDLKAVFFFSDGRRGGADPLPRLASLGVPVFAVGVGDPSAAPDLAVEEVRAPPFAFKNTDAQATVRLRLRGLPPGRTVLRVSSRGETIGRREVSWDKEEVVEATVTFRPSRTGLESLTLRASEAAGETNLRNNARAFTVDVARDRRRVLYICGRPGPHYAFLRHQLKSDPTVELVSFVILRDMEDTLAVPDRELSLIPFPSQPQLLGGLSSFDAVIFEDFSFNRFGIGPQGMEALRAFVEGGGGFLLLGQGDAFGPLSPYRGSPLEPLLPYRFDAAPAPGPAAFRAVPVAAGAALTSFAGGESSWESLPPLEGPGLFPGALRAGAVPLFTRPDAGAAAPWAALYSAGKGRTMAMDCLTTWRWALGESGEGRGPAAYSLFWTRTLNWLTGGDDFRRVRLELPSDPAAPGEDVLVRAHVRDESRRPLPDAEVRLEARSPDGKTAAFRMSSTGEGAFVAAVPAPAGGSVLLKARVSRGGRPLGDAEAVLRSGTDWDESRDVSTDFASLEAMARATGGRFIPLSGFDRAWASRALDDVSWETTRRLSPGSSPGLMLFLLLLLPLEWIFRRYKGFP